MGRNGWSAGMRSSNRTYENSPSDRASRPRMANHPVASNPRNHMPSCQSSRGFQQPVRAFSGKSGRRFSEENATKLMKLEPVDRPEEVSLSDRYAAMTQDVIRRRYKEKEIRQSELLQIVVALQFPVVGTGGPGDDLVLRAVHLGAIKRLHERERGFDAALGGGEAGVVHRRQSRGRDAGQAAAGIHGEIRRLPDLAREREHVGIQSVLQQRRFLDLVGGTMRGGLVDDARQSAKLLGAGGHGRVI